MHWCQSKTNQPGFWKLFHTKHSVYYRKVKDIIREFGRRNPDIMGPADLLPVATKLFDMLKYHLLGNDADGYWQSLKAYRPGHRWIETKSPSVRCPSCRQYNLIKRHVTPYEDCKCSVCGFTEVQREPTYFSCRTPTGELSPCGKSFCAVCRESALQEHLSSQPGKLVGAVPP